MPVKFYSKTVTFNRVEYKRNTERNEIWYPNDGTNEVLTGPEELPNYDDDDYGMFYMYSTVAKDYFPVIYRTIAEYGSEWFDKSDDPSVYKRGVEIERLLEVPGYIEEILHSSDQPLKMLKKIDFKMKRFFERIKTDKSITLEHIKWLNKNFLRLRSWSKRNRGKVLR